MTPTLLEIANAPDPLGAEDVVPNGTIAPSIFLELVQRYQAFQKQTAESFIKIAETVVEAKKRLLPYELRKFCEEVGLDFEGSTFRKLVKIGQEASRFEPFLAQLPNNWTTLYKLASLENDKFAQVASDECFGPMMTASEVNHFLDGNETSKRHPNDCSISLAECDRDTKLEVRKKLVAMADEYGFKCTFSPRLERALKQPREKPSLAKYTHDEPA